MFLFVRRLNSTQQALTFAIGTNIERDVINSHVRGVSFVGSNNLKHNLMLNVDFNVDLLLDPVVALVAGFSCRTKQIQGFSTSSCFSQAQGTFRLFSQTHTTVGRVRIPLKCTRSGCRWPDLSCGRRISYSCLVLPGDCGGCHAKLNCGYTTVNWALLPVKQWQRV